MLHFSTSNSISNKVFRILGIVFHKIQFASKVCKHVVYLTAEMHIFFIILQLGCSTFLSLYEFFCWPWSWNSGLTNNLGINILFKLLLCNENCYILVLHHAQVVLKCHSLLSMLSLFLPAAYSWRLFLTWGKITLPWFCPKYSSCVDWSWAKPYFIHTYLTIHIRWSILLS